MEISTGLLKSILDTLHQQVLLINRQGQLIYCNQGWLQFIAERDDERQELEYLNSVADFRSGVEKVVSGVEPSFSLEYADHPQQPDNWFLLQGSAIELDGQRCCVVVQQDISDRKRAEQRCEALAVLDKTSQVATRSVFDEFFHNEWRRCTRLGFPISLVIIDIDDFALYNRQYGQAAGDNVLEALGTVLNKYTKRPGDLCARYGGYQFALVYSNAGETMASELIANVLEEIRQLRIEHSASATGFVSISAGAAIVCPDRGTNRHDLISAADQMLSAARAQGGNRQLVKRYRTK